MPAYTDLTHGTPFWVDLESPDIAGSMSFYSRLFSWGYVDAPPEEVGGRRYAWAENSSGFAAGVYQQDEPQIASSERSHWVVQILVDDMAEVVGRADTFGGAVAVDPSQVGEYGISATLVDPTGCEVTLWQPFQSGPTIKHEHGSMQWCEVMSTDADATIAFFRGVLEVKTDPMEMPDGSTNAIVVTDDGPVMSISALSGLSDELVERAGGSMWVVYFNVEDVDAAVERAVSNGAKLPDPPWDVPGVGRMAWIYDPQGTLTALITPPEA